jgi:predicted PurR-regulated permease PerM
MTDSQRWMLLAGGVLSGALLYLLAPVLTPFATGVLLAYLGDPLADRLETYRLSRTWAVIIVFVTILTCVIAAILLLVPMLEQQISALVRRLPGYVDLVRDTVMPTLADTLGLEQGTQFLDSIKQAIVTDWRQAGGVAVSLVREFSQSGLVALTWVANIVLVPVVTFYLLRDWDVLVGRVHELIPRSVEPNVTRLTKDCDAMLAEFLRGQLLVMAALAFIYSVGLSFVGLDLALLIGLTAGLVSFVPYLGFVVGIVFAVAAAYLQFQEPLPLLWVALVFGFGQLVEGMLLTPMLVGDRIGLHPVAVIFAVMAGGQLFGFLGVLLALPVAAVVMVLLRYAHERYLESDMYHT